MALKEGKLFYGISEVSAHFDVTASLLCYWESEFPSIKPRRNPKGTRFYSSKDIDEIRKIYYFLEKVYYFIL